MKNNHKLENCALEFPITIDFLDLCSIEQVVEEAFIKEPKKRRRKA
jgi:hypothetical protein